MTITEGVSESALHKYVLTPDGGVQPAPLLTWAAWLEDSVRAGETLVGYTLWGEPGESWRARVATYFLGIDYRLHGGGPPLLYETAISTPTWTQLHGQIVRTSDWDRALAAHADVVRAVTGAYGPADRDDRRRGPERRMPLHPPEGAR